MTTPNELDEENKIASVGLMNRLRMDGDGICHRLARIYFAVEDEDVKIEVRKAVYSAKKMSKKLRKSKTETYALMYKENPNSRWVITQRKKKLRRKREKTEEGNSLLHG